MTICKSNCLVFKLQVKNPIVNINASLQDLVTTSSSSIREGYVTWRLQRLYPGLLRHTEYGEINEPSLNIMNQDWKNKYYIRIACGQLLTGSIPVKGNEAFLINCIQLSNCKLALDPHYKCFGSRYIVVSCPSMNNKYNSINMLLKADVN
ncbi:hypothetical protein J3Q64DRAFT_1825625 [Phycomyces blakesleeanus]|uniref:Uncharacterized protein n=2 Tax=Phycomyces blakesleeanus TaxID=4837 RepID=A0A167JB58_PHYB8|nr:hypothetical protein PHYBLDRAFT_176017 [Phycomyces blakesleeanus NRRL 1555(-)]OAD65629.1 hypothetical protein PHYBLDRAFT_176017 [Phycomyces blakesleeanus NRRL 1555(-)]|eukprot:XP_018283669.1 hypothetical protein PHYBLDRAFT_176017 [Phycomyces blakesleeanus NRRL 1555(-)]